MYDSAFVGSRTSEPRDRDAGRGSGVPLIEHHGVIGDLHTVALVDLGGTIDFLCWPRFDSPTLFCSLLDPEKGGSFTIAPRLGDEVRHKQIYLPDTNVLITRFLAQDGLAEITDLMPVDDGPQRLVRIVRSVRGSVSFDLCCAPRFDYARASHELEPGTDETSVVFRPERGEPVRLASTVPIDRREGDAVAGFTLEQDQSATFLIEGYGDGREELPCGLQGYGALCFSRTVDYWRDWTARTTYQGRWRETVHRSGLILKLLTHEKEGSMVAAPTFALPEVLGGGRNWDYRYTWIRDAAFTLYALIRLGYTDEAHGFVDWIGRRVEEDDDPSDGMLQVLYCVDGTREVEEKTLEHLRGYADSRPVRIGNGAAGQLQLDIYGALLDAIYLANKYGCPISHDAWCSVVRIVEWVAKNWEQPDEGIWEFRGGKRDFLHSRLMCWVCLDRAVRLARKRSLPAPFAHWEAERDRIYDDIFANFWNEELQAFTQAKGGEAIDASCLLMPLVKFISPVDPRWLSTLDAVRDHLADDALVRRYDVEASADVDGLEGEEGSFTACSFWYVECLARAGRVDEARLLFEKMLSYANHVGLYAEELGNAGDHLGNFPQALTHLALISAAHALDRAIDAAAECSG
jgi:pentatricopeptide repeat protein